MTVRIYISGPMTGIQQFNFPAFNAKAAELRSQGMDVVNPAEFGEGDGLTWSEYMRKDIRALMDCNGIYMLPGWMRSRGALLEHHIATELGFSVMGAQA
jgi:hypothetical protein